MLLFLAFVLVPLIEIALFIQIGGAIGLWPTLAIVILTAILGTWLVRQQGLMTLGRLQRAFAALDDPTEPLAHGAMILIAGALLLTPGFFTDAIGFALLVPPVRQAVFRWIRSRVTVTHFEMGGRARAGAGRDPFWPDDVIDGEFEEIDPDRRKRRPGDIGPSGWVSGPDRR